MSPGAFRVIRIWAEGPRDEWVGTRGRAEMRARWPLPRHVPALPRALGVPAVVSFLQEADISPGRQPGLSLLHRRQEPGTERTVAGDTNGPPVGL